jgi:RHS repeat-associated protein
LYGSLDKQGTVVVNNNVAAVNHQTTNFTGYATVIMGTNVVPVVATDYNGNSRTNKYQLVVTNNGVAKTITYDLNGNETLVVTSTTTNSYQWDAVNRLVAITGPTNQSVFAYDGLGRRVQSIESQNGVAISTNTFLWVGQTLAEQRDATGVNVVKRFFGQGEQISGTNYYFTRDHLGSVREMTDSSGTIHYRGDYDPYGRQTKLQGDLNPDVGYAGMYYHAASGLNLTLFRAYDSDLGRWLSRDPLAENAGLNLYAYVFNDPIKLIDSLGLWTWGGVLLGAAIVTGVVLLTVATGGLDSVLLAPIAAGAAVGGTWGAATTGTIEGTVEGAIAGAAGGAVGGVGVPLLTPVLGGFGAAVVGGAAAGATKATVQEGINWTDPCKGFNGKKVEQGALGGAIGGGIGWTATTGVPGLFGADGADFDPLTQTLIKFDISALTTLGINVAQW